MARLQILELPEGAADERSPFVLVVDQCFPQRVIIGQGNAPVRDHWQEVADRIGARAVIVTPEMVEIPANELPLAEPIELVSDVERMDRITDALGLDRLRDWDEICAAAEQLRVVDGSEKGRG